MTQEKVFFIAGDEFGDLSGHTLIIKKALYSHQSSGLQWQEKFANILQNLGFKASRAEPDIWMRQKNLIYEYIGVYVDNLAIAALDPEGIIKQLEYNHNLKLKGTGPIKSHLGCDFNRDDNGTLHFGPKSLTKC
jgi:Reverse transcriptase (RNA-dependent DNA polymerase)